MDPDWFLALLCFVADVDHNNIAVDASSLTTDLLLLSCLVGC